MALIKDDGTIAYADASNNVVQGEHWFTNKTVFNSAEYFEFTGKHNNTAADGYTAISVGDLKIMFALDKNDKGIIDFTNDGKLYLLVMMGDAIIYRLEASDWEEATTQWIIPKIDNFGVVYDNGKITAYYARTGATNNSPIVTDLDLTTLEGWNSNYTTLNQTVKVGAYCWYQKSTVFSALSLAGKTPAEVAPEEPEVPDEPEVPEEPEVP